MGKTDELIQGRVIGIERNGFIVDCGFSDVVFASIGGKLRKNKIMITVGDSVKLQISPYDLTKGIIKYRN